MRSVTEAPQEAPAGRVTAIDWHGYALQSAAPLGALARGPVRRGALLRVRFGGAAGYADLHPWAELGDLPLAGQLGGLARGEATQLSRASLAFAALDAEARAAGRSLWEGLTVPDSHFLLPGLGRETRQAMESALAEGFTHFKVKAGKDLEAENRALRGLCSFLEGVTGADGKKPRLRLDYNGTLTAAQVPAHFAGMECLRPFLDFVEDPCRFEAAAWASLSAQARVAFAVDRDASEEAAAGFAGVVVHKPARSGPLLPPGLSRRSAGRLVVTSYLDHPVGQLCAAWAAAHLPPESRGETHGLVSHRVYATTPFSERLGRHGPRLRLPGGTGLGFDAELAALEWKPLK